MSKVVLLLLLFTIPVVFGCGNGELEEEKYNEDIQQLISRIDEQIEAVEKEISKIKNKYGEKAEKESPRAHPVIIEELAQLENIRRSLQVKKKFIETGPVTDIRKTKIEVNSMIKIAKQEITEIREEFKYIPKPKEEKKKEEQ